MLESLTRITALVVTNTIKLAGLYVGVHELFVHSDHPNAIVLAYSAFLVAGGQLSETTIMGFIDKFFGLKGEVEK